VVMNECVYFASSESLYCCVFGPEITLYCTVQYAVQLVSVVYKMFVSCEWPKLAIAGFYHGSNS
jgi:hypothetical protein